jgi:hypothetical protein
MLFDAQWRQSAKSPIDSRILKSWTLPQIEELRKKIVPSDPLLSFPRVVHDACVSARVKASHCSVP